MVARVSNSMKGKSNLQYLEDVCNSLNWIQVVGRGKECLNAENPFAQPKFIKDDFWK
jgi:hypothetical protein